MTKVSAVVHTKPVVKSKPVTKEISRDIPSSISSQTYVVGKAAYNPRAAHNIASWDRMLAHLAKAGEKGVSGKVLAGELLINEKHPDQTHFTFISYLERRGALAHTK